MSQLTLCQEKALDEFVDFLASPGQYFVLTGAAGSGKSFLTKKLLEALKTYVELQKTLDPDAGTAGGYGRHIAAITATTNKAASVLLDVVKGFYGEGELTRYVSTIHSFLGLTVKNDYKTGKVTLERKPNADPVIVDVLFIDEASMMGTELWNHVRTYLYKNKNTKVVFIGDPYQLTPVKESPSAVFNLKRSHLKTTVRQAAKSPLHAYSSQFRDLLEHGMHARKWPTADTVEHLPADDWWRDLLPSITADPAGVRALCWSNARAVEIGKYIRKYMGKGDEFEAGEYVALNNGCSSSLHGLSWLKPVDFDTALDNYKADAFFGDQEVCLNKIDTADYTIQIGGHSTVLTLCSTVLGNGKTLIFFAERSRATVASLIKYTVSNKMWMIYFWLKELGDIRTAYAQTIHKSQGSTYSTAFIDLDDVGKCRNWVDTARLMYVASTRPHSRLVLTGLLPTYNWSNLEGGHGGTPKLMATV